MPFFNFRRNGPTSAPNAAAAAAQHESVEVIRKRAKHRLIGAAVLVLAGVIGFPLLFDAQPRPIAIDIPIEIPGKSTAKSMELAARSDAGSGGPITAAPAPISPSATPVTPATPVLAAAPPLPDKVAAAASLAPKEEIIADKKSLVAASPAPPVGKTEIKPAAKSPPQPAAQSAAKPAATADDGARAKALLNGQAAAVAVAPAAAAPTLPTDANSRIVVQVGAFADATKAREVRLKLEKAGMKTYTQVAETPGGKRIRVRVGPFATRAEADKAASKIKRLDLQAAVLIL